MSRQSLMRVGGDLMGQPDIVHEALGETYTEKDAWDVFMCLLDIYDLLHEAFRNAWPDNGVVPFAISKGLTFQDAEDISQKTAAMVWDQFKQFKPYIASWNTWILMIAERQIAKHWRDTEEERDNEAIGNIVQETIEIDRPGWSVPIVCNRWIESGDQSRANFARIILMAYYNIEWVPASSTKMARATGVSRKKCLYYFRWFATEVISMEMTR